MGLMQPLRAVNSRSHAPRGNAYRLFLGTDSSVPTQSAGTSMNMHRGQMTALQSMMDVLAGAAAWPRSRRWTAPAEWGPDL